jgi:moderate conductance mechanosensitive channel
MNEALQVVLILAIAWALMRLLDRGLERFRRTMDGRIQNLDDIQRVVTLSRVFRHTGHVVIIVVAIMLVLQRLGVSIAPLLATAGVAGIAVGFGAQSLVKDYFSGMFMLLEDQIRQGDVVAIAGREGVVEEVTLRYVRLRDFAGHVHFVPNSEVKIVTNLTRGHAQALIEVAIPPRENADAALALMREVGAELRRDPDWRDKLLGDLEVDGIERWTEAAVVLRGRLKVVAAEQWNVRREFLRRFQRLMFPPKVEQENLRAPRDMPRPARH